MFIDSYVNVFVSYNFVSKGANSCDLININCYTVTFSSGYLYVTKRFIIKRLNDPDERKRTERVIIFNKTSKCNYLRTLVGRLRTAHVLLYIM